MTLQAFLMKNNFNFEELKSKNIKIFRHRDYPVFLTITETSFTSREPFEKAKILKICKIQLTSEKLICSVDFIDDDIENLKKCIAEIIKFTSWLKAQNFELNLKNEITHFHNNDLSLKASVLYNEKNSKLELEIRGPSANNEKSITLDSETDFSSTTLDTIIKNFNKLSKSNNLEFNTHDQLKSLNRELTP